MFLLNSRLTSFVAPRPLCSPIFSNNFLILQNLIEIKNLSESLEGGEILSRTYDRCIAEFLNEDSPVHLRLLASPTCVGFRYGRCYLGSRKFSWQRAQ